MRKLLSFIAILMVAVIGYVVYLHKDVSDQAVYVTSEECRDCHVSNYDSWKKNTLHPYMFRPVNTGIIESPETDILGDFDSSDPALTFKKEDIEYVLGNKWEQVYARMIDGEYYPLPAKWHVMLEKWEAYKVDDWKEVPMSKKCNGCHTTGFDPATLEFAEFGIGCEACHGPGSTHVQNKRKSATTASLCTFCHADEPADLSKKKDIIRSVSATVCGQCHNRGQNAPKDGVHGAIFNFPVNYKPGEDLKPSYTPMTQKQDKKAKYFWGNGIAKNRHQEFGDWSKSKHANAVTRLKEAYVEGGDRGELKDECLYCHSTDYRHADEDNKPTLDTAQFGVTCVACHEPHGHDKKLPHAGDGVTQCGGCHVDSMSHNVAKTGKSHYPCPTATVTCADCHMPRIVSTGGFLSIRNHGFKIVTPMAAEENNMPSSCQNGGCHEDKSVEWMIDAYQQYYPEKISN